MSILEFCTTSKLQAAFLGTYYILFGNRSLYFNPYIEHYVMWNNFAMGNLFCYTITVTNFVIQSLWSSLSLTQLLLVSQLVQRARIPRIGRSQITIPYEEAQGKAKLN